MYPFRSSPAVYKLIFRFIVLLPRDILNMYILLPVVSKKKRIWYEEEDEVSFFEGGMKFTVEFLRCWNHHALLLLFKTCVCVCLPRTATARLLSLFCLVCTRKCSTCTDPRFFSFSCLFLEVRGVVQKRTQSPPPGRRRRRLFFFFFFFFMSIGICDWRWRWWMAKTTQRGATSARAFFSFWIRKEKKRHDARC
jgi:hypothetical protein